MTIHRGWSHESTLGAALARRAPARLAFLIAFTMVGVSTFDAFADDGQPLASGAASPNQSLALEPPQETVLAEAEGSDPATQDRSASTSGAVRSQADIAETSGVSIQKRRLLPVAPTTKRTLSDALRADAGAAPWYRSGLGATTIVLGLIFLVYLGVRRCLPGVALPESSSLRVAARVALTPRHSLVLVRVGRRYLVLGLSPDHVSAVCDIQQEEEVAELTAHFGAGRSKSSRFGDLVAAETESFTEKSRLLAADDRRSVVERADDIRGRDPWMTLADLRRRIRSLRNRGADVKAVI